MSRRTLAAGGLATAAALTLTALPATAEQSVRFPSARFPLGTRPVPMKTMTTVTQGIDLYDVKAGTHTDGYTVTVLMPNGRDFGTLANAELKVAEVEAAGESASLQKVVRPGVADSPSQTVYMVRVGLWAFKDKKKAEKTAAKLKDAGLKVKVDYLGDDGLKTTGPWNAKVVLIDSRTFRGSYAASIGTSVAKRETVSSMAKASKALVGVNGGFYNIHTSPALRGEPLGASVVGGRLLSEAVPGRSAVVLKGRTAKITELETSVTATSEDGARTRVDGVNRAPATDELVLYTQEFGAKTPTGGVDALLDANDRVLRLRPSGHAVGAGTRVLHGRGLAGDWLNEHAWEGWTVEIDTRVIDLRTKKAIPLTPDLHVVAGGVGLVRNGEVKITAKRDGHDSMNMILRRHPRTLVGTTKNGSLILAAIDGRRPGETIGANFVEAAQFMRWLGATQAINLDGGGSTTLVVGKKPVNRPADGAERAVGDALLVLPR
ncbi:phosphodiester glycosidase family protein [Nonomuraea aridisoli]|uniref:N-acetylglucosamine-1-phosphodiester alpha-N-acetylglucosaminidase-like protein n=1 Tax=Nonomuraea aridisoli TaxID=2070368 RepID=A0A2W2EKP8_9ACTN|nr:phosphodiester glycosidase family protein [Nonomuraea aridisoli]PZG12908.1 N-acetylglucosamine-1-phosphodiester alpha-N-acetylglucosaminidase-like protein [Nonomuraea aridisoli]